MSRFVDGDFLQLTSYLSNYSLSLPVQNSLYIASVKKAHKRYLAALTFSAEIEQQSQGMPKSARRHAATVAYFKESASDIGSALFCLCHGAKKPARVMLRSALETTAKGLAGSASLAVLKKKSVFSILEDARKIGSVKSGVPAQYFSRLEALYADLCKDVHTASIANMAHVAALNSFPSGGVGEISAEAETFSEVAIVSLTLQVVHFREYYHHVHYKNGPVVRGGLRNDAIRFLGDADADADA